MQGIAPLALQLGYYLNQPDSHKAGLRSHVDIFTFADQKKMGARAIRQAD